MVVAAQVLVGATVSRWVDVGRHVPRPTTTDSLSYHWLLAATKIGVALLSAGLAWRILSLRCSARAAGRVLTRWGRTPAAAPRLRLAISSRLSLALFGCCSGAYLAQSALSTPGSSTLGPALHSSALAVFATLSVLVACLWTTIRRWLRAYEAYAEESVRQAVRLSADEPSRNVFFDVPSQTPRRLFGLAFESRPPPLHA